ncbi:M14 family zinc carboxypeptidase [Halobaculum limi]|uniref:M14 family zinc carboxypeptidase n=1 Tax=Halobaculum limi TaxID=3031916 RepID=UPI0024054000|nr:M14 family zinc carboxypeptidase [Halobaculum sp. YSMS11]
MTGPPSESSSSPARTFAWVGDAVPRYQSFHTVADHRDRSRALAAEHDHVAYRELGETPGGEDLWAVTVGEGDRAALLFGAPHPNEPIGSMTVDFLLHELAANAALRDSLDYEFVCVPVADPDGVRQNEGWFDGPFTLSNYAQNFYRPPPDEQIEATFPIEHEEYTFSDATAGTEALADLVDEYDPAFQFSLHNAPFGGCYYYSSEALEPLHDTLQSLPEEYGVPLNRGDPENHRNEAFADGVFRLPTFEDRYDDVADGDEPPQEALLGGNAYDYARRATDGDPPVQFVVELPYFRDPRVGDETELDRSRETVIREAVAERRPLVTELRAAVAATVEWFPDTSMAREVRGVFDWYAEEDESRLAWAESEDETDDPATVAQQVEERYTWTYHLLTNAGMLLRTLDHAAMAVDDEAARRRLVDAKAAVERVFTNHIAELQQGLDYDVVPIRDLVAIQARAGLVCLDYLQKKE